METKEDENKMHQKSFRLIVDKSYVCYLLCLFHKGIIWDNFNLFTNENIRHFISNFNSIELISNNDFKILNIQIGYFKFMYDSKNLNNIDIDLENIVRYIFDKNSTIEENEINVIGNLKIIRNITNFKGNSYNKEIGDLKLTGIVWYVEENSVKKYRSCILIDNQWYRYNFRHDVLQFQIFDINKLLLSHPCNLIYTKV